MTSRRGVTQGAGPLIRQWRTRRRRSQLDLALDVGVSTRHLSFVETGRARPSPELLMALARGLDVPLRECNAWLLAAGYAPRYPETPLDAESMGRVRATLQRLLDGHDPYPGVVIDRFWNVLVANRAALLFLDGVAPAALAEPLNVFRLCLHPDGLAARTRNFEQWSAYLLGQLHRAALVTGDASLAGLADEVAGYPNLDGLADWRREAAPRDTSLLVPWELGLPGGRVLSLFGTVTTFGTPQDVTLAELAVELFYPADEASEQLLREVGSSVLSGHR
ncbi:MAG: helix-turn-helix domain-containing protein [Acidimicrobiia bacterium]